MQDQPKIFKNKIVLFVIGAVVVATVAIGVFATVNIVNGSTEKKQSSAELKASADELKARAIKAQKSDNDAAAIELLEKAKTQYELAGDKSNVVDTEALLYLSNHAQ